MKVLEFVQVFKAYSAESSGLKDVSFQIHSGEFTALAGPSGSGKTTILNLAAGLDFCSAGKVKLLDKELKPENREELDILRRDNIGFIFQAYNLFPVLSALENVEYPLALQRVPAKERKLRAQCALNEVGLSKYANRFPNQLSGGQQQRVAIARAMVTDPKIVFADEPTANLDSKSAEKLLDLFARLNSTTHTTFLFSSHDARVLNNAKRVITLTDGSIVSDEKHKKDKHTDISYLDPMWAPAPADIVPGRVPTVGDLF